MRVIKSAHFSQAQELFAKLRVKDAKGLVYLRGEYMSPE